MPIGHERLAFRHADYEFVGGGQEADIVVNENRVYEEPITVGRSRCSK